MAGMSLFEPFRYGFVEAFERMLASRDAPVRVGIGIVDECRWISYLKTMVRSSFSYSFISRHNPWRRPGDSFLNVNTNTIPRLSYLPKSSPDPSGPGNTHSDWPRYNLTSQTQLRYLLLPTTSLSQSSLPYKGYIARTGSCALASSVRPSIQDFIDPASRPLNGLSPFRGARLGTRRHNGDID